MKHVILTLGVFGMVFLTSCNNTTEEVSNAKVEQEHPNSEEHPASEEHSHDDGEAISLNDGEKWEVNEEMRPHVQKGEELVIYYSDSGDEDYKSLATNLASINSNLISSCTMDGTSHDELHKWLHPHLELTKELKNAGDVEEANEIVNELINSYSEYHKYFN